MLIDEFKKIKEEWSTKIALKHGEPAAELFLRQIAVLEAVVNDKVEKIQNTLHSLKDENNIIRGLVGSTEVEIKAKLFEKVEEANYLEHQLIELKNKLDSKEAELEEKYIFTETLKSQISTADEVHREEVQKMNESFGKLESQLKEIDKSWTEKNNKLAEELKNQRRMYHNKLSLASIEIWKFSHNVFSEWIKYTRDQMGAIFSAADYLHENIISSKTSSLKKVRKTIEPDLEHMKEKIANTVKSFDKIAEFFSSKPELAAVDVNLFFKKIKDSHLKSTLSIKWPPESDYPKIVVDEKLLREALEEIIKNSIESAQKNERGAEVVVSVEHDDINIFFDVSDNGPGVPLENIEKLFTPFFTTKPHREGMGLARAKRNIVFHSGEISYINKSGMPTFRIKINHE